MDQHRGGQLPHADHLEPVVGVRDDEGVVSHVVEDRHVVGGEGADAAVATLLEVRLQVLETFEEHSEGPAVVLGEPVVGLVGVAEVSVRVHLGFRSHSDRDGPALKARCAHTLGGVPRVRVDVVLDHLAVTSVDGRVHQLDVQHRAVAPVGGAVVDARRQEHLALQQTPVGPHGHVHLDVAVGVGDVQTGRATQPLPVLRRPCAGTHHHLLTLDPTRGRLHGGDRSGGVQVVSGDRHAVDPLHPELAALLVQAPHDHVGAGVAGPVLVQDHVAVRGLEVGPESLQEPVGVSTRVEVRGIPAGDLRFVQP